MDLRWLVAKHIRQNKTPAGVLFFALDVILLFTGDRIKLLELEFHIGKLFLVLAGPIGVTCCLVDQFYEIFLGCHNGEYNTDFYGFCKYF